MGHTVINDDEMIYYSKLAAGLGGRAVAHCRNAVFLVLKEDERYWPMDNAIEEKIYLVSESHSLRAEGVPPNSLSVGIRTGRYFVELNEEERSSIDHCHNGFRRFFSEVIRLVLERDRITATKVTPAVRISPYDTEKSTGGRNGLQDN